MNDAVEVVDFYTNVFFRKMCVWDLNVIGLSCADFIF